MVPAGTRPARAKRRLHRVPRGRDLWSDGSGSLHRLPRIVFGLNGISGAALPALRLRSVPEPQREDREGSAVLQQEPARAARGFRFASTARRGNYQDQTGQTGSTGAHGAACPAAASASAAPASPPCRSREGRPRQAALPGGGVCSPQARADAVGRSSNSVPDCDGGAAARPAGPSELHARAAPPSAPRRARRRALNARPALHDRRGGRRRGPRPAGGGLAASARRGAGRLEPRDLAGDLATRAPPRRGSLRERPRSSSPLRVGFASAPAPPGPARRRARGGRRRRRLGLGELSSGRPQLAIAAFRAGGPTRRKFAAPAVTSEDNDRSDHGAQKRATRRRQSGSAASRARAASATKRPRAASSAAACLLCASAAARAARAPRARPGGPVQPRRRPATGARACGDECLDRRATYGGRPRRSVVMPDLRPRRLFCRSSSAARAPALLLASASCASASARASAQGAGPARGGTRVEDRGGGNASSSRSSAAWTAVTSASRACCASSRARSAARGRAPRPPRPGASVFASRARASTPPRRRSASSVDTSRRSASRSPSTAARSLEERDRVADVPLERLLVAPTVLLLELRVLPDLGRDLAPEGLGLAAGRVALLDRRAPPRPRRRSARDAPASTAARRAPSRALRRRRRGLLPGASRSAAAQSRSRSARARAARPLSDSRSPDDARAPPARSPARCARAPPSRARLRQFERGLGVRVRPAGGGAPCLSWAFSWQRRATSSSRAASSAVSSAASVPPATSASRRFSWSISSLYGRLGGACAAASSLLPVFPPW